MIDRSRPQPHGLNAAPHRPRPRRPIVTRRIVNTRLLIYLPTSGLIIYLPAFYLLIYLPTSGLLTSGYLFTHLFTHLFTFNGVRPHPLSPTLREFCSSDNAKTKLSVCDSIIMHNAVPTSFKRHPIPDGLITVSDGVDFRKKDLYNAQNFPKYLRKSRLRKSTLYSVKGL